MILRPKRRLVWDLETNGLLDELDRIHILVIMDADTSQRYVFHNNDHEDTIPEGIEMLNEAELIIGHNSVDFDAPALWKVYGNLFDPQGIQRDTMVMARMLFSNIKERDFKLWKRGTLHGSLIGSNELKAWGQRLGLDKGDYSDLKKEQLIAEFPHLAEKENKQELNRLVWAEWSQEMEDYAVRDVEITLALWRHIESKPWSAEATVLEHQVHALMGRVQRNGFPLDIPQAKALEESLRISHQALSAIAEKHFGCWWAPEKWVGEKTTTYVNPVTNVPEKDQPIFQPRAEFGEDQSRVWWGEVKVPKRSTTYYKKKDDEPVKASTEAGCPYTAIKLIEFNPNSRDQIINRLQKVYGWEPQDFTETGRPSINDEVLRDLATRIPICDELAEIFYYSKRLGQLVDGKNGLIGKAEERGDGKIHARINVGGTVTNRASHSSPNIAQVPRVVFKNLLQWWEEQVTYDFKQGKIIYGMRDENGEWLDQSHLTPLLGPDGEQLRGKPVLENGQYVLDDSGKVKVKKSLLKGRAGDHGWDFRNLFYVPDGWVLMGADQKGIELRCLGHFMAEFDNGEYMKLVVESDPHDLHQSVMELDNRDTAKTFIYAMVYGAQDYKLGITIDPTLAMYPSQAKALGTEMRRRLMTRIPALGAVIKAVQREAKRGYVEGLDGRHLFVRGSHSALNTKLQGAAATIAKKWCVLFEQMCEEDGLVHGWDGDFAIVTWVHDEIQVACRDDERIKEIVRSNAYKAAVEAGRAFGFRGPVDIDHKFGKRWSQTH